MELGIVSRQDQSYAAKLLAKEWQQFRGHAIKLERVQRPNGGQRGEVVR